MMVFVCLKTGMRKLSDLRPERIAISSTFNELSADQSTTLSESSKNTRWTTEDSYVILLLECKLLCS